MERTFRGPLAPGYYDIIKLTPNKHTLSQRTSAITGRGFTKKQLCKSRQ